MMNQKTIKQNCSNSKIISKSSSHLPLYKNASAVTLTTADPTEEDLKSFKIDLRHE